MLASIRRSSRLIRTVSKSAAGRYAGLPTTVTRQVLAPISGPSSKRLASSSASVAYQRPSLNEEPVEEDPDSGADDFAPDKRTPFTNVEDSMHRLTYKAITQNPFKHTDMSPVQAAVLSLLPELAEPYRKSDVDSPSDRPTRDLLVRAKTGTGKTLAFLVPAIEARLKTLAKVSEEAVGSSGAKGDANLSGRMNSRAEDAYARRHVGTLIISPTRELASQIVNEALKLTKHHGFNVHLMVGGESKSMQIRDWHRGRKDILVATPGRLRDMLQSVPAIKDALTQVNTLVLDEADTLLDMGFRNDIESIIECLPPTPVRQTLLFSATVSPAIQQIAKSTLDKNFGFINCVGEDDSPVHAHIPQFVTVVPSGTDLVPHITQLIAHDQLSNPVCSKIILFSNTTKGTHLYSDLLRSLVESLPDTRTSVMELHSKKTQEARARTSDRFRHATAGSHILVTSDVSARGVDYPGVTRVIQLGVPAGSTQYIHRVGRTGRGRNTEGRGDLVLLPFEKDFARVALADVPIKPATVEETEQEVLQLAERFDASPGSFTRPALIARGSDSRGLRNDGSLPNLPARPAFKRDVRQRMESLKEECERAIKDTRRETVEESVAAMLGFYAGRREDLNCRRSDIVEGVKSWCREAFLTEPPYFSPAFLGKIGLVDGVKAAERDRRSFGRNDRVKTEWTARDSRRSHSVGGFEPRRGRGSGEPWRGGDRERRGESVDRYRSRGEQRDGYEGRGRRDRDDSRQRSDDF